MWMFNTGGTESYPRTTQGTKCTRGKRPSALFFFWSLSRLSPRHCSPCITLWTVFRQPWGISERGARKLFFLRCGSQLTVLSTKKDALACVFGCWLGGVIGQMALMHGDGFKFFFCQVPASGMVGKSRKSFLRGEGGQRIRCTLSKHAWIATKCFG